MSISSSYEILHSKCVDEFSCSNIVLSITLLLLVGTLSLYAITVVLIFSFQTVSQHCAKYIILSVNHPLSLTDIPSHLEATACCVLCRNVFQIHLGVSDSSNHFIYVYLK